jgi:hypothetical protein
MNPLYACYFYPNNTLTRAHIYLSNITRSSGIVQGETGLQQQTVCIASALSTGSVSFAFREFRTVSFGRFCTRVPLTSECHKWIRKGRETKQFEEKQEQDKLDDKHNYFNVPL